MSTYEAIRYNFTGANVTALNGSNISAGTIADARVSASSVNQHVDLTSLNASNLTSGTIPNARYGTPTFNGSNLTSLPASAPSSSDVGTATAGLGLGVVGSYAMLNCSGAGNPTTAGNTAPGSLQYSGCGGTKKSNYGTGPHGPSGTWKLRGLVASNDDERRTSICLRTA